MAPNNKLSEKEIRNQKNDNKQATQSYLKYFLIILVVGLIIRVYMVFSPVTVFEAKTYYYIENGLPLQKFIFNTISPFYLRIFSLILYVIAGALIWFYAYSNFFEKLIMMLFITLEPHFLVASVFGAIFFLSFVLFLLIYFIIKRMENNSLRAIVLGLLIGVSLVTAPHVAFYLIIITLFEFFSKISNTYRWADILEKIEKNAEKIGMIRAYIEIAKSEDVKEKLKSSENKYVESLNQHKKEFYRAISSIENPINANNLLTGMIAIIVATSIALPFGVIDIVKAVFWFPWYFVGPLKGYFSQGYIAILTIILYFPIILLAFYLILFKEIEPSNAVCFILLILLPLNPYLGYEDLLIPMYFVFEAVIKNLDNLREIFTSSTIFRILVFVIIILSLYQSAITAYASHSGIEPLVGGAFVDMKALDDAKDYSLLYIGTYPTVYICDDADVIKYYVNLKGFIVDKFGNIIIGQNISNIGEGYMYMGKIRVIEAQQNDLRTWINPWRYFMRLSYEEKVFDVVLRLTET